VQTASINRLGALLLATLSNRGHLYHNKNKNKETEYINSFQYPRPRQGRTMMPLRHGKQARALPVPVLGVVGISSLSIGRGAEEMASRLPTWRTHSLRLQGAPRDKTTQAKCGRGKHSTESPRGSQRLLVLPRDCQQAHMRSTQSGTKPPVRSNAWHSHRAGTGLSKNQRRKDSLATVVRNNSFQTYPCSRPIK
jgi:hypothetical protein